MNKRSFKKLGLESSYEIYNRIVEYYKSMEPLDYSGYSKDVWVFPGWDLSEIRKETLKEYLPDNPSVVHYDSEREWVCDINYLVEDGVITEEEKELLIKDDYVDGDYIYINSVEFVVEDLYKWLDTIPDDKLLSEGWYWVAFAIWTGSKIVTIRNRAFARPKGRDLKRAVEQILRGEELDPKTGYEYY